MNRIFNLITFFLIIICLTLLNALFLGEHSYKQKKILQEQNNLQNIKNNELKNQNDILSFEIQNAQNSDEHIENFAREKLGLSYPEEEYIVFKEQEREDND